jgi:hypothetical protein
MHSYKKKSTIIDTSINHNEHINFILETQLGKPTLNGVQFFILAISSTSNAWLCMHLPLLAKDPLIMKMKE